ncbi:MAG: hypothetical protein IIC66_06335 [candidate division Zixibacteria bacterium]|nr:hypothetical protein [candidate division Zixibacteria bacterium]
MTKNMIRYSIILTVLICSLAIANESENKNDKWLKELNVPTWVKNIFYRKEISKKYDYAFNINPMYLLGDFDGDNSPDVAILVREKSSSKLGIIVIHYASKEYFVVGAGQKIGNGGDDFKWMSNWSVERKGKVGQGAGGGTPPELKVEALLVEKAESASGIIYWDGKKYVWYQQGD